MRDYLVFRLYGPMAAWGDVAVGEERPTALHPTKSAILGLLGAALGIKRSDTAANQQLHESLGMACRVDQSGVLLRDYHTVQMPTHDKKARYTTRKDELSAPHHLLNTLLSYREYRMGMECLIAVWCKMPESSPFPLEALHLALLEPQYVLYLGRKACPPALPLEPQIISQAQTLRDTLGQATFNDTLLPDIESWRDDNPVLYWENEEGVSDVPSITMQDVCVDRKRWLFQNRSVCKQPWTLSGDR